MLIIKINFVSQHLITNTLEFFFLNSLSSCYWMEMVQATLVMKRNICVVYHTHHHGYTQEQLDGLLTQQP